MRSGSRLVNRLTASPLISPPSDFGIGRLLLVCLLLLIFLGLFVFFPPHDSPLVTILTLSFLAVLGVMFLFATITGFVNFSRPNVYGWFDSSDRGVCITDSSDRIIYANSAYGALFGFLDSSSVLVPARLFGIDSGIDRMVRDVRSSGRPGRIEVTNDEGEKFLVCASLTDGADDSSDLVFWEVESLGDIDNFFGVQHAVHYLDHLSAGFLAVDSDKVVYMNATIADWLKVDLADFAPASISSLFMPELVFDDDSGIIDDSFLVCPDGSRPVSVHYRVLGYSDGAPGLVRLLVVPRDSDTATATATADTTDTTATTAGITDSDSATSDDSLGRELAHNQKIQAIGRLSGEIAHDFNNVLTAIIGYSDLLLGSHRPSDPSFPDIMQIKQNANRAAALVRQLLAFSRRQTLRPQVFAVPDVLANLRMLLIRTLGDSVRLELNHGRDLWLLRADIGQFEQVIVNLCANARDAILDSGSVSSSDCVTISTSNVTLNDHPNIPLGDYVLVEVLDTGMGMSPEVMSRIYEPYFSTKEVGRGTGLGLSAVHGIIEQSGGYILVDSEVGSGSTFRLYFPRHAGSEDSVSSDVVEIGDSASSSPQPKSLVGASVIIFVEDEDAVRSVGCRTLRARGYTVYEASNGVEALELYGEHGSSVDLVVSDVVMPEMDGPTLLREVRKLGSDVPFVFASGYAEASFEENLSRDEDSFEFIPKPYSLKQLVTCVKEVLERGG